MAKIKILFFVIILSIFSSCFAQSKSDSVKTGLEFNAALDLYNAAKYRDAQEIFEGIVTKQAYNAETTIAYLFYGKSLLGLKEFDLAIKVLNNFIEEYPGSKYVDEAKATIAYIYYVQKDYYDAVKELDKIIASTESPEYDGYARNTVERLAEDYLTVPQLKGIYDSTSSMRAKPYLLLTIGKMYINKKQINNAEDVFTELMKQYPNSEEKSDAAVYYQHIMSEKQNNSSSPIIGVMLPLSHDGLNADNASSEILEGIKYAVDKYNQTHDPKIGILIRDTERNKNKIEKIKNEFEHINSLIAIIGPVYSNEVKYALNDFKNSSIPIISPTATDDNLADIDSNFFQANTSFSMRGKVMADYIFYVENKRKMGVLNATTGYSPILANAFINEFQKLGGQIIVQQTYNIDSTLFSNQISRIVQDSTQLEGLYLPLSDKNDVPILLSQFAQYNFDVPIYGNQDWFLAKGYESYPALSNKLTFSSDYYIDYTDSSLEKFSRNFFNQTNINVDRDVLYGFDIADYLLPLVHQASNRRQLEEEMTRGNIYSGFHNGFFFNKEHVNCFMNIVRYRDGKFELVDRFKAGK